MFKPEVNIGTGCSQYRTTVRASADRTSNAAIAGGGGGGEGNHDPADELLNGKFRCKFHHATVPA
jgi:hypothetical protein